MLSQFGAIMSPPIMNFSLILPPPLHDSTNYQNRSLGRRRRGASSQLAWLWWRSGRRGIKPLKHLWAAGIQLRYDALVNDKFAAHTTINQPRCEGHVACVNGFGPTFPALDGVENAWGEAKEVS